MLGQDRSVPHLQIAASCPHFGNSKERFSSPGGLSHSSPCHPAASSSPVNQGQGDGRLQVAPHARTAAGLEGGVERKGREDTRVSRHCLRAPLGLHCWWGKLCSTSNVSFPKRNFPKDLRTPTVREESISTSSDVYSQVFEVITEMGS